MKMLGLAFVLILTSQIAQGQIFVTNVFGTPQTLHGLIGEYNFDGTAINPAIFSPGSPSRLGVSGSDLYVLNGGGEFFGSVDRYSTSGGTSQIGLIPSLTFPRGLAVSGSNLFISDAKGVHKYDTSGHLVTDSFTTARFDTYGLTVSDDGSHLFIAGADSIGEYDTTTGATISDTFITGLDNPYAISISGSKIYVANFGNGTNGSIGEYASDGSPINPALITGLTQLYDVADYGGKLFTVDYSDGLVGEYDDTSGAVINPSFITDLSGSLAIAVVPEPAAWMLLAIAVILLLMHRLHGAYK